MPALKPYQDPADRILGAVAGVLIFAGTALFLFVVLVMVRR